MSSRGLQPIVEHGRAGKAPTAPQELVPGEDQAKDHINKKIILCYLAPIMMQIYIFRWQFLLGLLSLFFFKVSLQIALEFVSLLRRLRTKGSPLVGQNTKNLVLWFYIRGSMTILWFWPTLFIYGHYLFLYSSKLIFLITTVAALIILKLLFTCILNIYSVII